MIFVYAQKFQSLNAFFSSPDAWSIETLAEVYPDDIYFEADLVPPAELHEKKDTPITNYEIDINVTIHIKTKTHMNTITTIKNMSIEYDTANNSRIVLSSAQIESINAQKAY